MRGPSPRFTVTFIGMSFLSTHTTNGSDHQFTVTLIATQPEKMHPEMQEFFRGVCSPNSTTA